MRITLKRISCISQADERVALIIQIRLAQYNIDAAEKELNATKSWAQDSMLAQLAEVNVSLLD
jgi:coatomer protein complex subunit epsilon